MEKTTQDKIIERIRRNGRGKVFASTDFLGLGNRAAVDQVMSRLVKIEFVVRVARGLYYYQKFDKSLGTTIPPQADEIASALARQGRMRVVPAEASVENQLGLTTQFIYLTDGKSRRVNVGYFTVILKHASPRKLPEANLAKASHKIVSKQSEVMTHG